MNSSSTFYHPHGRPPPPPPLSPSNPSPSPSVSPKKRHISERQNSHSRHSSHSNIEKRQPSSPPPQQRKHSPKSNNDQERKNISQPTGLISRWLCGECGTSETPVRRGGPSGPSTLCNACGLRLKKREKNAAASLSTSSSVSPSRTIVTSTVSSSAISSSPRARRNSTTNISTPAVPGGPSTASTNVASKHRVRKQRHSSSSKRSSATKRTSRRTSKQNQKEDISSLPSSCSVPPTASTGTDISRSESKNTKVHAVSNCKTEPKPVPQMNIPLKYEMETVPMNVSSIQSPNINIDDVTNKQNNQIVGSPYSQNPLKLQHSENQIQLKYNANSNLENSEKIVTHDVTNLTKEFLKSDSEPPITNQSNAEPHGTSADCVGVQQGILGEEAVDGVDELSSTDSAPLFFIDDPMATEMERAMVELEQVSHDLSSSMSMITEDEASDGGTPTPVDINFNADLANDVHVCVNNNGNIDKTTSEYPNYGIGSESANCMMDVTMHPTSQHEIASMPKASLNNVSVQEWSPMTSNREWALTNENARVVATTTSKKGFGLMVPLGVDEDFLDAREKIVGEAARAEMGALHLQRRDMMMADEEKSLNLEEETLRRRLEMITQRRNLLRQQRLGMCEQVAGCAM